ncbi:MAG: YdcF family protein [Acetobacteraceae bacterium]|nr:YdcF family protein [Acetobacteraceae bacterium]
MRRAAATLAAVLAAGLLVHFVWFLHEATRAADPAPRADAILVLTGAALRLDAGRQLLAAGAAPRLFVSGVNPQVRAEELGLPEGESALGREARDTRGNGIEAAAKARREGWSRVVVVTSAPHMPRALVELRRAAPEVRWLPHPVPGSQEPAALLREYAKLVAATLGVTRLGAASSAG